jgi:hypothetical protein
MDLQEHSAVRGRAPGVAALALAGALTVAAALSLPGMFAVEADAPAPQTGPDVPMEVVDVSPADDSDETDVLLRQCLPVEPSAVDVECTEYLLVLEQPDVRVGDTVIVQHG